MRLGADPELFLVNTNGKYISAIGKIGGTKQHPLIISDNGHAVQEDNVACEFNIPPCESANDFIEAINFSLDYLKEKVKEQGLSLSITASAGFDAEELNHPKAREFGCEPDYNAWTKRINPRPHARNKTLRSAGGHIHIETELEPFHVAKCFDLVVVIPSLSLDDDIQRRDLYGKAGSCRIKSYGVECRSLSNFWLASNELKKWVWDKTQATLEFAKSGYKFSREEGQKIQACINNSNIGLMYEILQEYNLT